MNDINLNQLENTSAKCELCDLHKNRLNPVFSRGTDNADIMVCGMCPGPDENKEGYPFVEYAPAGSILNEILDRSVGRDVYITNLVKCFVKPGITLEPVWMSRCLPYLIVQIQLIKPKVIITLGKDVANFLLNNKEKMGAMRGCIYNYLGAKLISTYHPSYLARGGGIKHQHFDRVVKDFNKAKEFI